jgi:uncharacterized membrane protein
MEEQQNSTSEAPQNIPTTPTETATKKGCCDNSKLVAILAYLLVGIVWYFVDEKMKKDEFAKFHVKQGILLLIASIAIQIVGSAVPFIGWFVVLPLGNLLILILCILGIINAATDKKKELPCIGQYSEKIKI